MALIEFLADVRAFEGCRKRFADGRLERRESGSDAARATIPKFCCERRLRFRDRVRGEWLRGRGFAILVDKAVVVVGAGSFSCHA